MTNLCIQNLYSTPTTQFEASATPHRTYLTESGSLPVSERRVKSAMTKRTSSCIVEPRKKTVHFVQTPADEPDSVDIAHCHAASPTCARVTHDDMSAGGAFKDNRRLDHHPRVKPTLAEARRKASQEVMLQRLSSDVTRPSAPQRHVINLSHYLSERTVDSDAESQCADSDTTTSGSYCFDDDDLAHDVLV